MPIQIVINYLLDLELEWAHAYPMTFVFALVMYLVVISLSNNNSTLTNRVAIFSAHFIENNAATQSLD
jgi:hypothetical protein